MYTIDELEDKIEDLSYGCCGLYWLGYPGPVQTTTYGHKRLIEKAQDKTRDIVDYINMDSWKTFSTDEFGFTGSTRATEDPVDAIKTEGTLHFTPEEIAANILDINEMAQSDSKIKEVKLLEKFDDYAVIVHMVFDGGLFSSNRDAVLLFHWFKDDEDKHFITVTRVNHPDAPETGDWIRVNLHTMGYVIVPNDDSSHPESHVYFINHTNPGGMIPAFMVNAYNREQTTRVKQINDRMNYLKQQSN